MEAIHFSARPGRPLRLAICGGGASMVLLLAALRRRFRGTIHVTVIEPRGQLGLGLAYSTPCAQHLLNTRAGNMSAGDDPDDFLQWLRKEHPRRPLNWTRNDFAPRQLYGKYLQARLQEIRGAQNIHFNWLQTTADSIVPCGSEWEVIPARGEPVRADAVVLATGNEPPRSVSARAAPIIRPFILDDPWDAHAKAQIESNDRVLLIGTGLTAVDIAIELMQRGHAGPIYAISRRGLLPRCHGPIHRAIDGCGATLPTSLRGLVRHVRTMIARSPGELSWQSFMNDLRSVAPTLWARWSQTERRRFLRHLRPYWDVHRHRLAPQINARISRAQKSGQLSILRGRIAELAPTPLGTGVRIRIRQLTGERLLDAARVIVCTGPEADPRHSPNLLLQHLISDSLARPDALGLGLAVDQHSRVIGADGAANQNLYALGSLTRGSRWEVTSIAEIREQASTLAQNLSRDFARDAPLRAPSTELCAALL